MQESLIFHCTVYFEISSKSPFFEFGALESRFFEEFVVACKTCTSMTFVNSLDHKYTHCHGNIPKGHFMNKLQMYQKFVRQLETRFSNQRLVSRIHFHDITINLQKKVSRSFYLNFTFMSPNLLYAFD